MKKTNNRLTSLPNIGKIMAGRIEKIGISTTDEFLEKDPFVVFNQLLKKDSTNLCRCALASVVGAKLGVPWYKITKETSIEFEKRYPQHQWKNKC